MPTKSYSNANLDFKQFLSPISGKRYSEGMEPEPQPSLSGPAPKPWAPEGPSAEELLRDAHATLNHANSMASEHGTSNLANLETRLASLSQGPRPSLSKAASFVTEPFATVGHGMQSMALPAALAGPEASAALYGAGTAISAPDAVRRYFWPEEGEDSGDAGMELALDAAIPAAGAAFGAARKGVGAVRGAMNASREAEAASAARNALRGGEAIPKPANMPLGPGKLGAAREVPYQDTRPAVDPNQVIAMAREIAAETGVPVEKVMAGYAKSGGLEPGRKDALSRLLNSGRQGRIDADPLEAFAAGPKIERGLGDGASVTAATRDYAPSNFDSMSTAMRGDRAGLRQVLSERNNTGSHTLAPQGRPRGSEVIDTPELATVAEPLGTAPSQPLSPIEILRARAMERFGKRYYQEF